MAKAATAKKTAAAKPAKETKPKVEKAPKEVKPKQEQANGVTRPRPGNTVARVWEIADQLSNFKLKEPKIAARADVLVAAENEKINAATAATQYGRWRRFHGITGRSVVAGAAE